MRCHQVFGQSRWKRGKKNICRRICTLLNTHCVAYCLWARVYQIPCHGENWEMPRNPKHWNSGKYLVFAEFMPKYPKKKKNVVCSWNGRLLQFPQLGSLDHILLDWHSCQIRYWQHSFRDTKRPSVKSRQSIFKAYPKCSLWGMLFSLMKKASAPLPQPLWFPYWNFVVMLEMAQSKLKEQQWTFTIEFKVITNSCTSRNRWI